MVVGESPPFVIEVVNIHVRVLPELLSEAFGVQDDLQHVISERYLRILVLDACAARGQQLFQCAGATNLCFKFDLRSSSESSSASFPGNGVKPITLSSAARAMWRRTPSFAADPVAWRL